MQNKKIDINKINQQASIENGLTELILRVYCLEELLFNKQIITKEEYKEAIDAAVLKLVNTLKQMISEQENIDTKLNTFITNNKNTVH